MVVTYKGSHTHEPLRPSATLHPILRVGLTRLFRMSLLCACVCVCVDGWMDGWMCPSAKILKHTHSFLLCQLLHNPPPPIDRSLFSPTAHSSRPDHRARPFSIEEIMEALKRVCCIVQCPSICVLSVLPCVVLDSRNLTSCLRWAILLLMAFQNHSKNLWHDIQGEVISCFFFEFENVHFFSIWYNSSAFAFLTLFKKKKETNRLASSTRWNKCLQFLLKQK